MPHILTTYRLFVPAPKDDITAPEAPALGSTAGGEAAEGGEAAAGAGETVAEKEALPKAVCSNIATAGRQYSTRDLFSWYLTKPHIYIFVKKSYPPHHTP